MHFKEYYNEVKLPQISKVFNIIKYFLNYFSECLDLAGIFINNSDIVKRLKIANAYILHVKSVLRSSEAIYLSLGWRMAKYNQLV